LHSIEKIIAVLEHAPLTAYSEPSYRLIAERWRDAPMSALGAFERGGRYNAPHTFPVLYTADSQMTALLEAEALFTTADGQLRGAPRDPDLILSRWQLQSRAGKAPQGGGTGSCDRNAGTAKHRRRRSSSIDEA